MKLLFILSVLTLSSAFLVNESKGDKIEEATKSIEEKMKKLGLRQYQKGAYVHAISLLDDFKKLTSQKLSPSEFCYLSGEYRRYVFDFSLLNTAMLHLDGTANAAAFLMDINKMLESHGSKVSGTFRRRCVDQTLEQVEAIKELLTENTFWDSFARQFARK